VATNATCNNFSSGGGGQSGTIGRTVAMDGTWTVCGAPACNQMTALYCFQQ
jgi:hypothetical protein